MLPYRDSRVIRLVLIIFFTLAVAYGLYEAQGILYGPVINVPDETLFSNSEYTAIRGSAERISELRLNGMTVSVTENGEFNEPFLLAEGTNRVILEAKDARGRTTVKTLDIVYTPPKGVPTPISPPHATSTIDS